MENLNEEKVYNKVANYGESNLEVIEAARAKRNEIAINRETEKTQKQLAKDEYNQEFEVLEVRFERKLAEIKAKTLKARTAENDRYLNGGVTRDAHEKALEEITKTQKKETSELEDEYETLFNNLRLSNVEGYHAADRSWRKPSERNRYW